MPLHPIVHGADKPPHMLLHLLQVTQAVCSGAWSSSASKEALELGLGGALQVKEAMRAALLEAAVARQEAAGAAAAAAGAGRG